MSQPLATTTRPPAARIAAWLLMLAGMWACIALGLLPALLAGLLVYQLTEVLAPLIDRRMRSHRARAIAVVLLAAAIIGLLTGLAFGIVALFRAETGGGDALLVRLMDIIDGSRAQLPPWLQHYLPDDLSELRAGEHESWRRWGQNRRPRGGHRRTRSRTRRPCRRLPPACPARTQHPKP